MSAQKKGVPSLTLAFALASVLFTTPLRAVDQNNRISTSREYFSTNPKGRLHVRVQVWGDVPLTGIHHVPDDIGLVELLSIAGGPTGSLDRLTIRWQSTTSDVKSPETWISGENLLVDTNLKNRRLSEGDVIYVEVAKDTDPVMRGLTFASTITGLITSVIMIYILTSDRK